MNRSRFFAVLAIIVFGALLRLVTVHLPVVGEFNFAPVGAIAIFCGLTFRDKRIAFGAALFARIVGDVFLTIQNGAPQTYLFSTTMAFVYLSVVAYVLCGMVVRLSWKSRQKSRPISSGFKAGTLGLGSLLGCVTFFVISNFGAWIGTTWYAKTMAGLADCFVAAIPFIRATVLSDSLYLFGMVGTYAIVRAWTTSESHATALLYAE